MAQRIIAVSEPAVSDPDWLAPLQQVLEQFSAPEAVLLAFDFDRRQCSFGPFMVASANQTAAYARIVERCPWLANEAWYQRPGAVVLSGQIVGRDRLRRSSFHRDWLQPRGFGAAATLVVERSGQEATLLQVMQHAGAPDFSPDQVQTLSSLWPYLGHSLRLGRELFGCRRQLAGLQAAIDRLCCGVVLMQPEQLVCNRMAAAILAENDGLAVRQGKLVAARAEQTEAIGRLIVRAGNGSASAEALVVHRPSGRLPLALSAHPAAPGAGPADVVLFIVDPSRRRPGSATLLGKTFDLTPAEARVAAGLAMGDTVEALAQRMQVTTGTIRNHLKRVFAKTRTSRQHELVALIGQASTLP